jgi:hypothetical protein
LPFVAFIGQSKGSFLNKRKASESCVEELEGLVNGFKFRNTFGELHMDKVKGSVFLVNYESGRVFDLGYSGPDVLFVKFKGGEGLDLLVLEDELYKFRPGLVYCYNRHIRMMEYSIQCPQIEEVNKDQCKLLTYSKKVLTDDLYTCQGMCLHPLKRFVLFFGRREEFLSHDTSYDLYVLDLETKAFRILVNRVEKYNPQFNGFHSLALGVNKKGFLHQGEYFVVNTIKDEFKDIFLLQTDPTTLQNNKPTPVSIKPFLNKIKDINNLSIHLEDISHNHLIISVSNMITPERVYIIDLSNKQHLKSIFNIKKPNQNFPVLLIYSSPEPNLRKSISHVKKLKFGLSHSINFESVFIYSASKIQENNHACKHKEKQSQLACLLHGGPFSTSIDTFNDTAVMLLAEGFDVLCVNYRGSGGYGSNFQDSLIGYAGVLDLQDCKEAILKAREMGFGSTGVS